jgi:hypothetical protein
MIISCGKRVRTNNGYVIQFRYEINGATYDKRQYESFDFKERYQDYLLNKKLVVIYEQKDYTKAFILVSPEDFKYLKYPS